MSGIGEFRYPLECDIRRCGTKERKRPVLNLPWAIEFVLEMQPNDVISERDLFNAYQKAGLETGLSWGITKFPNIGTFNITKWL